MYALEIPTSRDSVLLKKLIVAQLLKKFLMLMKNRHSLRKLHCQSADYFLMKSKSVPVIETPAFGHVSGLVCYKFSSSQTIFIISVLILYIHHAGLL
jgi:hypothetical protein